MVEGFLWEEIKGENGELVLRRKRNITGRETCQGPERSASVTSGVGGEENVAAEMQANGKFSQVTSMSRMCQISHSACPVVAVTLS